MRFAVFSDVHGNLQALTSVLERIDEIGADRRLCLGDIVGYGGNPNECVEVVRLSRARSVAGNHDHAVLGLTPVTHFNAQARAAALWTREVLGEENRRFLAELPLEMTEEALYCVHASPREPDRWTYVLTPQQAEEALDSFDGPLCLIGHSHRPLVAVRRGRERCVLTIPDEIELDEGARYLINAGSVGQPRDGDPRAGFLMLDTDRRQAWMERVSYDIEAAARAIHRAGLPGYLAERLKVGR